MKPSEYKTIRESLGTQAKVARMLGSARETIARRETGKDKITREAAVAMVGLKLIDGHDSPIPELSQ